MNKLICFILMVCLVLGLAACGGSISETSNEATVSSESISKSKDGKTESTETAASPEKTKETSSSAEKTAESGTSSETENEPEPVRSFGKITSDFVAEVNKKTISNEGSGVFDVLGDLSAIRSVDAVAAMIEAYSLPDKAYYGNEPVTDTVKQKIADERALEELKAAEDIEIRYGILTENADVRSFPTDLRATDTGAPEEYDFLQETKLCLASGVIVLHTSKSGEYLFVQGYNYNGWVKTTSVALCSEDEFREFLTPDRFLICKYPDQSDPLKRLGEILPITKSDATGYTYAVPLRKEDGSLLVKEITASRNELSEWYHEGFYDWSEETCLELMGALLGFPYGWGDTDNAYDCSSTIGGVYQCFGFVLPRNTGIMKYFGVHSEDVEGKTYAEVKDMIASHPSAILIFRGHALMSMGIRQRGDGTDYVSIFHNTKGWYVPDGDGYVYQYKWCVTDSCPEEMLKADGTMTLDYLTRIIWVE